jgi:hypothetical protein
MPLVLENGQSAAPLSVPWWLRWRHRLGRLTRHYPADSTAAEVALQVDNIRLRELLTEREQRILDLRAEIGELKVQVHVKDAHVRLLTEVVVREQTRVRAETAMAAHKIAEMTGIAE